MIWHATTDAIYEECGSDWSHQVSAVGKTQWLQRDHTHPLSAKGVTCETSSVASTLLVYMSIGKYSVHCKTTKKCLLPSDSEGLTPQMGTSFTKIQGIVAPQFQKSASYIFNRLTYVNKLTQMLFSQWFPHVFQLLYASLEILLGSSCRHVLLSHM